MTFNQKKKRIKKTKRYHNWSNTQTIKLNSRNKERKTKTNQTIYIWCLKYILLLFWTILVNKWTKQNSYTLPSMLVNCKLFLWLFVIYISHFCSLSLPLCVCVCVHFFYWLYLVWSVVTDKINLLTRTGAHKIILHELTTTA